MAYVPDVAGKTVLVHCPSDAADSRGTQLRHDVAIERTYTFELITVYREAGEGYAS